MLVFSYLQFRVLFRHISILTFYSLNASAPCYSENKNENFGQDEQDEQDFQSASSRQASTEKLPPDLPVIL